MEPAERFIRSRDEPADVYPWAGELGTVGIAKGVPFCPPEHLETYGGQVFGRLATDGWLRIVTVTSSWKD